MKPKLHALVGSIAILCIATFWMSSLISELFLSAESVVAVKNAILDAMWLMIPAMVATGASGFSLGRGRKGRLIEAKTLRMKIIAANGLLLLLPSAVALASMANRGRFDAIFYTVQAVELVAGAVNLVLLALNVRDGLRLSGHSMSGRVVHEQ